MGIEDAGHTAEQAADAARKVGEYLAVKAARTVPVSTSMLASVGIPTPTDWPERMDRMRRIAEAEGRRAAGMPLDDDQEQLLADVDAARASRERRREEGVAEARDQAVTVGQLVAALERLDPDLPVRLQADPEWDEWPWLAQIDPADDVVTLATDPS